MLSFQDISFFNRSSKLSFAIVRTLLGSLLLCAAGLKLADEGSGYSSGFFANGQSYFSKFLILNELILGSWLLSGLAQKKARIAAIIAFSCFAGYSFILSVRGNDSCGCFGQLHLDPRITFAFDFFILALLIGTQVTVESQESDSTHSPNEKLVGGVNLTAFGLTLLMGILVVVVVRPLISNAHGGDEADAHGGDEAEYIVLKPQDWIGKQFPLLDQISIDEDLTRQTWTVVLYSHNCARCQALISQNRSLLSDHPSVIDDHRIAFVEIPPYGRGSNEESGYGTSIAGANWGRLSESKRWFATTPIVLELCDGFVRRVLPNQIDAIRN